MIMTRPSTLALMFARITTTIDLPTVRDREIASFPAEVRLPESST